MFILCTVNLTFRRDTQVGATHNASIWCIVEQIKSGHIDLKPLVTPALSSTKSKPHTNSLPISAMAC